MTKAKLAAAANLTPRRIAAYENSGDTPPPTTLASLAEALGFPVEFFGMPEPASLGPDRVSFRSLARLSASSRDAALAGATLALDISAWIDARFELPEPALPELRDLPPEEAASALRSIWGLGELPVPNLVHLLEMHGVRVFSLPDDCAALDAVSAWIDGVPFVFLTRHKSPERSRWDAAHELAHLLLHVENPPQGREHEDEADAFAREFLLPERGVRTRAPRSLSLDGVRDQKVFWKVSALAYIRRVHHLNLITDWQYKSLVIEATQAGYRRAEGDIEREDSLLIPKVLQLLSEDSQTIATIADELSIPIMDVQTLLFSPVTSLPSESGESITRPNLRLVR